MPINKSEIGAGLDDGKINNHYQTLMSNNKKDIGGNGKDVHDNPHNTPPSNQQGTGPMRGELMTWTTMLEFMEAVEDTINQLSSEDNIMDEPISDEPISSAVGGDQVNEEELLKKLNEIFTPILVMQGIEGDISDKIQEAFSESSVLMERNIISFDNTTKMAQLISVCALLIHQQRNTEKFQMYKKAAAIRNQMKIEMQKDVHDEAKALAQKFLVKVSTTNNSSVARDAATELLPETQH